LARLASGRFHPRPHRRQTRRAKQFFMGPPRFRTIAELRSRRQVRSRVSFLDCGEQSGFLEAFVPGGLERRRDGGIAGFLFGTTLFQATGSVAEVGVLRSASRSRAPGCAKRFLEFPLSERSVSGQPGVLGFKPARFCQMVKRF
jgi:hypothetical protein